MLGLKKLKYNKKKYFLKALFAVTLVFVNVFAFSLKEASAASYNTYKISDITVNLDIKVGSLSSNMIPDNYIRVGKDGSFYTSGKVTLVTAGSTVTDQVPKPGTITFDSDELDFINADDKEISYFGLGLENANSSSGGGLTCKTDNKFSGYTGSMGANMTYLNCDFPLGKNSGKAAQTVANGQALYDNSNSPFQVSGSNLDTSGATADANGFLKRIYIAEYPAILYDGVFVDSWIVFPAGGKTITVDVYDTQANAVKANQTQGRPTDVSGYGSNTSTGESSYGDSTNYLMKLINTIVAAIVFLVNAFVYGVFSLLIAPLIQAMLSIHVYTDSFVNVIYPGWEVIRNIANMLFIVALITIGVATLLRIESYHYRQLLVQIILAALLVNFSLVIGQAVLAVADTVQNQFLPANAEKIKSLAGSLMYARSWESLKGTVNPFSSVGSGLQDTVSLIFDVSLAFGAFCVFCAIGVFLVIRIVALWILLMISPIAYVAGILPTTAKYRSQWWDSFLKYAFFTPIMALFLNLAAIIATSQKVSGVVGAKDFLQSNNSNISALVVNVASNILLLVFLIASLMIAEKFSIAGAGTVTKWAKNGMWKPFNFTRDQGKKTAQRFNDRYGITDKPKQVAANMKTKIGNAIIGKNPQNPIRKFAYNTLYAQQVAANAKSTRQKKMQSFQDLQNAKVKDNLSAQKGLTTHHYEREIDKQAAEEQKNLTYAGNDELENGLKAVMDDKSLSADEKKIKAKAHLDYASANKYQDGFRKAMGVTADAINGGYEDALKVFQGKLGFTDNHMEDMVKRSNSAAKSQKKLQFVLDNKNWKDRGSNAAAQRNALSGMSATDRAQVDGDAYFDSSGGATHLAVEYASRAKKKDADLANSHMVQNTRDKFKATTAGGDIHTSHAYGRAPIPGRGGTSDTESVDVAEFTNNLT